MASKKELAKEAEELALSLEKEIDTKGLNHEQLTALVSDLKAKLRDAENDTQADDNDEDSAAEAALKAREDAKLAKEKAAAKKPAYYVAPGKAITSKKGILSGDTEDEVKAEYLADEKAFKSLLKSGHILKG